jgi:hypothetical protein
MVETRKSEPGGDPSVAILLSWFLPGAGHVYVGRAGLGVLLFVLLEGLYALGWWLSDGRVFEYLDPELRGPMATLLTPEAGNLGAMIWQLRTSGFGLEEPAPFPRWIALGSLMTALSGLLNLLVCVHAQLVAREKPGAVHQGRHPIVLLAAGLLFPGAGHWLQGRRRRGTIVALVLLGLFLAGTALAGASNLSRERHFYYWSGQFLLGAPAVLAEVLSGRPPVTGPIRFADVGLLYACMAGLLNVLALLDIEGVAEARWLAPRGKAPMAPEAHGGPENRMAPGAPTAPGAPMDRTGVEQEAGAP